jgi:polyhydroxyalkanoate synthesis regulator protein
MARPPPAARGALPSALEDEGPSLVEIVRRLAVAAHFIKQRAALVLTLAAGGALLGLATIFVMPPRWAASCEVKLMSQVKANPVGDHAPDEESLQFFQGAERAFTQPDLVRATLQGLDAIDRTEAQVQSVAAGLRLEPLGEHRFHASYKDQLPGKGHVPPLRFLTSHLQSYVRSEIDKSLRGFTAKAEFLRSQMKSVEKDLSVIGGDLTRFREANADRLPEDAAQTHTTRFQLESRRADLMAQVRRLEGELGADRGQLDAQRPLTQTKFQSSRVYRDSLADVNRKLTQAYAQGLADGHPEVQQLNDEKRRIEALIHNEMGAGTPAVDREANPAYQAVQNRVDALQAQLRAVRNDLADTDKSLGQIRGVVGELPRVEQRIVELTHMQEATTRLHGQLFERLMQAELQVNLERVSAESRYEITTARLERPRSALVVGLRGGLGLMVGVLAAAVFILIAEGKRLVREALGTGKPHHGVVRR